MKRVHLVGAAADDLGIQCGGWTIDWQGKAGDITPGGTTILAGLREVSGRRRSLHALGRRLERRRRRRGHRRRRRAALRRGDRRLRVPWTLSDEDQRRSIAKVAEADVPMVLVLLSGRPMILGDALDAADAVVAAWLPGTEGAGRRRRALGRPRADRDALVHLAEVGGPAPDQRRRRRTTTRCSNTATAY